MTVEIWFKGDNMASANTQVILGMAPYKLRKKSGAQRIQLRYKDITFYCDNVADLMTDTWYHFAFTVNENPMNMTCYLNGLPYSIGSNPVY